MEPDSVIVSSPYDTVYINFSFSDANADLGQNQPDTNYDLYLEDSRYDTFAGYYFPAIDQSIENPSEGISGTITFKQIAALIPIRPDSNHTKNGDTLFYELYIKDRAGHNSDTIKNTRLIVRP